MNNSANPLDLVQLIPREKLEQLATRWGLNKGTSKLDAFKLVTVMVWSCVFEISSLREIEASLGVRKSTLGDALTSKPLGFFEELFEELLSQLRVHTDSRRVKKGIKEILAIDSSVCLVNGRLCLQRLWRLGKSKAAVKLHAVWNINAQWVEDFRISGVRRNDVAIGKRLSLQTNKIYVFDRGYYDFQFWQQIELAGSQFVTRLKKMGKRLAYLHATVPALKDPTHYGVLYDGLWTPSESTAYRKGVKPKRIQLRHIIYRDPESGKVFDFLTSCFDQEALEIAHLYRKRWAVELLFRWLKGHLNIRRLETRNKNATRIVLAMTLLVQLLVRLKMTLDNSTQTPWEFLRRLRSSLNRLAYESCLQSHFQTLQPLNPLPDQPLEGP